MTLTKHRIAYHIHDQFVLPTIAALTIIDCLLEISKFTLNDGENVLAWD